MKLSKDYLRKLVLLENLTNENSGRFTAQPKVQEDPEKIGQHGETYKTKNGMYFITALGDEHYMVFFLDKSGKTQTLSPDVSTRQHAVMVMKNHHDKLMAGLKESDIPTEVPAANDEDDYQYDDGAFDGMEVEDPEPEDLQQKKPFPR